MTTSLTYRIKGREAYLTAITRSGADTLEVHVENADGALMRIGDISVKMDNGVGRVKLSTLKEGVFTPEIIFKDMSVLLYPISHAFGEVSLALVDEVCATLGARAYDAECRIAELENEVNDLKNAVYGKAIF